MVKLKTQGFEVLDPGTYVLEVVKAEPINVFEPQIKFVLRVASGEREGFRFVDFVNRGSEDGVKRNSKLWDIFAACLRRRLSIDEELESDDLIARKFEARVLVRRSGKGNHTQHGSIAPYQPEKVEPEDEPESEADDSWDWPS